MSPSARPALIHRDRCSRLLDERRLQSDTTLLGTTLILWASNVSVIYLTPARHAVCIFRGNTRSTASSLVAIRHKVMWYFCRTQRLPTHVWNELTPIPFRPFNLGRRWVSAKATN